MHNKNYCLITGASVGFGKALAFECAARKMNLILVALPGPELYSVADYIKRNYKVDVITIEKDLTTQENCVMLFKQVKELGLPVNMLINNAGLGSTMLFSEGSIDFFQKQINLNVTATTLLTYLFLDTLKTNGPSFILNVSSLGAYFFLPKKQVYGATKSFIYHLSKSLRKELKEDGISVSVVCPGSMNTNLTVTMLLKSSGWLSRVSVMNPEEVAPIAINGLLNRKEVIIPGKVNKIFLVMDKVLPRFIKEIMTGRQMKKIKSVTAADLKDQTILVTEKEDPLTV
jgi:short-subunit dehydrogenase